MRALRRVESACLSLALVVTILLAVSPGEAQEATDRSPNLSGGWVGSPGALHFHLLHRFWVVNGGDDDKLVNSPTLLAALPLPGRTVLGVQYASNSLVTPGVFNEVELFGRWAPLDPERTPAELGVTGAYNSAAGSLDGELSLGVPLGVFRLLGAARGFSDARGSGVRGWGLSAGGVASLRPNLALTADLGSLWIDGERAGPVWGGGVQLRIPTTPHTFSIQATNARTGTLQGATVRDRTTWGFEFTIPVTFARYFRRGGGNSEAPSEPRAGVLEVTMTDDLAFLPDTLEVQVGDTVVWRNTTREVHTVTADPRGVRDPDQVRLPVGAEAFDSGMMFEGDRFEHVFTTPGEYRYVCVPHDVMMFGVVRVREP